MIGERGGGGGGRVFYPVFYPFGGEAAVRERGWRLPADSSEIANYGKCWV